MLYHIFLPMSEELPGANVFRYAWTLLWMLWSACRRPGAGGAGVDVVHLHDLLLLPLAPV